MIENNLIRELNNLDCSRICTTCMKFKDYGTKHCNICKLCVKKYSFHSYYYNRCLNENNHLTYMIVLLIKIIALFTYVLRVFIFYLTEEENM